MLENILLSIVMPLVSARNILMAIVLPLVNAGDYFVTYYLATSDCLRIFFWLLCCH